MGNMDKRQLDFSGSFCNHYVYIYTYLSPTVLSQLTCSRVQTLVLVPNLNNYKAVYFSQYFFPIKNTNRENYTFHSIFRSCISKRTYIDRHSIGLSIHHRGQDNPEDSGSDNNASEFTSLVSIFLLKTFIPSAARLNGNTYI